MSDGTDEGTKQLTDINKGAASSSPSNIVEHKGEIYFSAKTNKYGQEIYILGSRSSKQTSNKTATRIVEDRKGSAKLRARQRASDEFLFRQSGQFGPKQADRIMNFNSQEGDYIALDPSAFNDPTNVPNNLDAQPKQPRRTRRAEAPWRPLAHSARPLLPRRSSSS